MLTVKPVYKGHYGIKLLILTVKPVYKGHYGIKLLMLTVKHCEHK
jgi:RNA binding exosome subunit